MLTMLVRCVPALVTSSRPILSTPTTLSAASLDISAIPSFSSRFSTASSFSDKSDAHSMVLDPLVVCGPSGVGKGTIIQRFMADHDRSFGFTVSHTTRNPRPGEIDGIHYHFVSRDEMEKDIRRQNLFLEHAEVHGNLYGTSWKALHDVQNQGRRCLLDIDVQGVQALKKQTVYSGSEWQPRFVFIAPPSMELLAKRLSLRGTEDEASLRRRTAMAKTEMDYGLQEGNFDAIIVNDDLDTACREFAKTVKALYAM
ncbi:guanylate kinase-like protein [Fragilaria crotonensis]|nr:guanylate kinase-like protein [Fragilaria crotonensis]